jgi:hypothetical protein
VVQVEQNGALLLADGRALLLERIRLPLEDGVPRALAAQTLATNIGQADGRQFIEISSDGRRAFSAVIAQEHRHAFRDFDLEELSAHHIRVRGIVQAGEGE